MWWLTLAFADPTCCVVPVQGTLTDAAGAPVDGTAAVRFRLYVDGSEAWTEQRTVVADRGAFAVALGELSPVEPALASADDLEITVELNGAESAPAPVGWAARAVAARWAATVPASGITGTIADDRLPATVVRTTGNQMITGTLTATGFAGSGAGLTNLPAAALSGTVPSGAVSFAGTLSAGGFSGSRRCTASPRTPGRSTRV